MIGPHPAPDHDVDRLEPAELARIRTAAHRVPRLYPGPVGVFVARELHTVADFGHRFVNGCHIDRLIRHILDTPDRMP